MSFFGDDHHRGWDADPARQRPSSRAQRALVRVLLALRAEARRPSPSSIDRVRAEALADRIMMELPRSVLPLGIAAIFIVGVVCLMPLVRGAVADSANEAAIPVARVVEQGVRERTNALNDGFSALREVVAPFAFDEERTRGADRPLPPPPADAAAPFSRS